MSPPAADLTADSDPESTRRWMAAIIESSDDAIISKDLNGIIRSWNEGARQIFGYTAAEIIGQHVTTLMPPERMTEEGMILNRLRRGERVHHYETVRRRKDGSLFPVSLTVSPIKNAAGQIIGASKIARDITDRKKIESAVRLNEERFRLLASHAPVGIFLTDESGACVYVNDRWCEMSGLTPAQAAGLGWTRALHPDDSERVLADWQLAVERGDTSAAEFRFLRPDGSVLWLQGNAVLFKEGAKFRGYLGSCLDITARKHAEIQANFLHRLSDDLAGLADAGSIKAIAQQSLGRHLGADRCFFFELDPADPTQSSVDRDWHQPDLASLAGRYALAAEHLRILRDRLSRPRQQIADLRTLPLPPSLNERLIEWRIRAAASTAHHVNTRWVFSLIVATQQPRAWTAGELDLIENVAQRVWPILERARALEALRASEQLYRAIGESINYGVWVCDATGQNLYVSDSFLRLIGLTQAECSGFNWTTLLPPQDREPTTAAWLECVRTGKTWERVMNFLGADGRRHPLLARGVPIRDETGRITRWVGLNLDIAAQERAKATERFLARLDHELGLLSDPAAILSKAAAEIGHQFCADCCGFIEQTDDASGFKWLETWTREPDAERPPAGFAPDELRLGLTEGVLHIADTAQHPLTQARSAVYAHARLGSLLAVPCHRPARGHLTLLLGNTTPRHWRAEETDLLEKSAALIRPLLEQARSARALQLSERRHRELLAGLPVACYTLDAEQRLDYFNAAAVELWGLRPALHEPLPAGTREQTGPDADDPAPFILRPDGSRRWVAAHPTPLVDANGQPAGLLNVLVDITGQRAARQAEQERVRTLEILNRTGNQLVAEHELEKIVQAVTDAGREVSGAAYGAFFYNEPNGEEGSYTLYTLSGLPRSAFAAFPMPRATAMFGPIFRGEGLMRIDDVLADPRYGQNPPFHGLPPGHPPVRSYLAAPVISRSGAVHGGLFFGHPEPHVFGKDAETLLASLTAQAAIAIDNARLYAALQTELEERRRKERLLRESEMRWRQLAEAMPHLVWSCEPDGNCDYLSTQWVAYTGAPAVEQLGQGWVRYVHPDDVPKLELLWETTIKQGAPLDTEFRIRRFTGEYRWFKTRAVPIRDQHGTIIKWYGSNTDIEDYRRIEQAIRASERQLQLVTDHAVVYIAQCDREHRFKFVNEPYARRFNLSRAQIVGRHISELLGPAAYALIRPRMDAVLSGRRVEFEEEIVLPGQASGWLHIIYEPERNAAAEVVGWIAVISDITARKQVEQELERARDEAVAASRAKDDFFAALSHELRTPLNPVLLLASDAAANPALAPDVRETFELVRNNISLEARLIDDLLDLTRITRGKVLLEKQRLDLHTVLRDTVANIRAEFAGQHFHLDVDLANAPATLIGDAVRLQQVMWNLLKNAVKFTPEGGHIRLRTSLPADTGLVVIEVTDDGIGLTPEESERIFEPFTQGRHTVHDGSPLFGGLGLGLAISRNLVQLHSGRIYARSPGPGCGSTFVVELPLAPADSSPPPAPAAPPPIAPVAPAPSIPATAAPSRRFLLVEDHTTTRITVQRLLTQRGYQVEVARNVTEARALAAAQRFDFLVSDVGLPDGDGYELMAGLRMTQPALQGIAMSGYGMKEDIQRSQAAGYRAHLVKPITIATLEKALAQLGSSSFSHE